MGNIIPFIIVLLLMDRFDLKIHTMQNKTIGHYHPDFIYTS